MSHDLVELLVVAVNAVLVGADTFAGIEWWAQEKLEPELKSIKAKRFIAATSDAYRAHLVGLM
ncbi:hypothetical protein FACS1894154_07410 [Betaproteobacteria bacterium]|nr:hypothetical protein FACS1894154_07410 [Betaproteobacteria bacterium]GHU24690.1 hypothetical protein FACS189488_09900 [Betaproteobacteria bacterium]GHU33368.1 hypothetical protein FACS189497_15110 [Betaproteobacteria bacterium]